MGNCLCGSESTHVQVRSTGRGGGQAGGWAGRGREPGIYIWCHQRGKPQHLVMGPSRCTSSNTVTWPPAQRLLTGIRNMVSILLASSPPPNWTSEQVIDAGRHPGGQHRKTGQIAQTEMTPPQGANCVESYVQRGMPNPEHICGAKGAEGDNCDPVSFPSKASAESLQRHPRKPCGGYAEAQ